MQRFSTLYSEGVSKNFDEEVELTVSAREHHADSYIYSKNSVQYEDNDVLSNTHLQTSQTKSVEEV